MTTVVGQAYTVTFDLGAFGGTLGSNVLQTMNFQAIGATTLVNENLTDSVLIQTHSTPIATPSLRTAPPRRFDSRTFRQQPLVSISLLDNVQASALTTINPTLSIAENSSNGTVVGQVASTIPMPIAFALTA